MKDKVTPAPEWEIVIKAPGIHHICLIMDHDDLVILDKVLDKIKANAKAFVEGDVKPVKD